LGANLLFNMVGLQGVQVLLGAFHFLNSGVEPDMVVGARNEQLLEVFKVGLLFGGECVGFRAEVFMLDDCECVVCAGGNKECLAALGLIYYFRKLV
jgi:hypothetical protein